MCADCAGKISDTATFCEHCGQPQGPSRTRKNCSNLTKLIREAIAEIRKCENSAPDNRDWLDCAQGWIASPLCNLANAERCLQEAEKSAVGSDEWIECWRNWCDFAYKSSDGFDDTFYKRAYKCLKKAEKVSSTTQEWHDLAFIYLEVQDLRRIVICMEQALAVAETKKELELLEFSLTTGIWQAYFDEASEYRIKRFVDSCRRLLQECEKKVKLLARREKAGKSRSEGRKGKSKA